MAVHTDHRKWERKLDGDLHPPSEQPGQRKYTDDVAGIELSIEAAKNTAGVPFEARACGSHWGISECSVTKGTMIETSAPVHEAEHENLPRLKGLIRDVVPARLSTEARRFFIAQHVPKFNPFATPTHAELYLYHVYAGTRIHELYSIMDIGDELKDPASLASVMVGEAQNADYGGPWACETLGGAGGQTIVGALTTGTHGGDVKLGPVASMAVALHLMDAEGRHHWIERTRLRPTMLPLKLADQAKIENELHWEYHSDDELFNAVVISCGRMGVICSVVLRAVRQYALAEEVKETDWSDVKQWLNFANPLFLINRFVSVEVNPNGQWMKPSEHTCFIRTRQLRALNDAGSDPYGRKERGVNPGTAVNLTTGPCGFAAIVCGPDDLLRLPFEDLIHYFETAREKAAITWLACAAVLVFPFTPPSVKVAALAAQSAAAGVMAYTTIMRDVVLRVLDEVLPPPPNTFGDATALAMNFLTGLSHVAETISLGAADLFFIIRAVIGEVFSSEAGAKLERPAISYGAMDGHNYKNRGCVDPGDAIEVFFDATSTRVQDFIEKMFQRVQQLESGEITDDGHPAVFAGYISVRFMEGSDALIAMQRWPTTCSMEIAGLSRVNGTQKFLEMVERDANDMGTILHWGQRNNWQMEHVEKIYDPNPPLGLLYRWREQLSRLTEHGRHSVFSTKFSKQRGLEITTPRIGSFGCSPDLVCADETTLVLWGAISNPPETKAELKIRRASGTTETRALGGLHGSLLLPAAPGITEFELVLTRELNGRIYQDTRTAQCIGVEDGDERVFSFTAELFHENGQDFWAYFQTLHSSFISNALVVTEVEVTFTGSQAWTLKPPGLPVENIPVSPTRILFPTRPVFNTEWQFRAQPPHVAGVPPELVIRYKLACQH